MKTVYIVSATRTAVGRAIKGTLKHARPEYLGGVVAKEAVARVDGLKGEDIDDIIFGCAMPEGSQGMNISRIIGFKAGLPYTVPAMTVNRFCSSGLQSIAIAAQNIMCGWNDVIIAGGVECMSQVPMGGYNLLPDPDLVDEHPEVFTPMGNTAELLAEKFGITREAQDEFAYNSNMKAVKAIEDGKFKDEIVPVEVKNYKTGETFIFDTDEGPRKNTTIEGLAKLKPVFKKGGTVTAGNSSQINDAAAAVVVMSEDAVKKYGAKPLARFVNYQVAGVPPEIMGIGPTAAIPKLFAKTGIKDADVGLYELNEAFACQAVHCVNDLGKTVDLQADKVNVNGGAIALGHPLGCTGAKLTTQILYEMKRRNSKYGVVSMCIGGGMGAAGLFELV
ncbi:MAG: thiolase family protein [Deltaproteobacteria bacterium]|nr:thiolase family protein [Deltaproteobacteria bacterium]